MTAITSVFMNYQLVMCHILEYLILRGCRYCWRCQILDKTPKGLVDVM